MVLSDYRQKRRFPGTPEPEASAASPRPELVFVIQKHAARRLHYDFRLEVDGVLKSWAVPKGPSYDPKDKRLAMHVEDHPLDYATFEGVIPERHYGAGNVVVWDYGAYSPDDEDRLSFGAPEEASARMLRQIEGGKVSVTLRGSKLRGSWALVRTKGRNGEKNQWLLIKHRDEYTGTPNILDDEASVISGRTLDEVSRGVPARLRPSAELGQPTPFPESARPMLATLAAKPFSNGEWLFEPKLDGVRAIASLDQGRVVLRSRMDNVVTDQYPEVAAAVAALPSGQLVLDGEIVALNDRGLPDFELLQQRMHLSGGRAKGPQAQAPVVYYIFDLLYADGYDLTGLPLEQRKAQLRRVAPESNGLRLVHYQEGEGQGFFQAAVSMGLEGMVAKRMDSRYEAGVRSRAWLKIKAVQEQEFVVCGYLPGRGHRAASFGALILGYYEGEELCCAGNVGSGFRDDELSQLKQRLDGLTSDDSPFRDPIMKQPARPRWLHATLVAQVKFGMWTKAGYLRAPVYLGLREDISPKAVVRERALQQLPAPPVSQATTGRDLVAEVCDQLANERESLTLDVGGARIKLTNLNKALWPAVGKRAAITKRDLARYLAVVSPFLLPHLKDRPMNLTRYPEGIDKPSFYQKHWATPLPEFVERVRLYSAHSNGDQEYIMVENLPTLVWLGQMANIELHPWLSQVKPDPDAPHLPASFTGSEEAIDASALNYPDFLIFDLDPYIYSGKE